MGRSQVCKDVNLCVPFDLGSEGGFFHCLFSQATWDSGRGMGKKGSFSLSRLGMVVLPLVKKSLLQLIPIFLRQVS